MFLSSFITFLNFKKEKTLFKKKKKKLYETIMQAVKIYQRVTLFCFKLNPSFYLSIYFLLRTELR